MYVGMSTAVLDATDNAEDQPPANLDTLPDDVMRIIWDRLREHCERHRGHQGGRLCDAFCLFTVCRRWREQSVIVERLHLGMRSLNGQLNLPFTQLAFTRAGSRLESSLLAPFGWAARVSNLKELCIRHLTWSGASRLITLLHAWPALEVLDVQFAYTLNAEGPSKVDTSMDGPYQTFANDLAASLRLGMLPRLKFLWIGNLERVHAFGQKFDDHDGRGHYRNELDDTVVLEQLGPTAAVWWMAERAQHVRQSKLHQFRYEIEHGADLTATFAGYTLLEWMRERLGAYFHSMRGHQLVHEMLVDAGAEPSPFRGCELDLGPQEDWGSDEYDTDYEERVADE